MADYNTVENRSKSRHHWEAHIRAQQKSGLSRTEYCRRHALSYHALSKIYVYSTAGTSTLQPLPGFRLAQ